MYVGSWSFGKLTLAVIDSVVSLSTKTHNAVINTLVGWPTITHDHRVLKEYFPFDDRKKRLLLTIRNNLRVDLDSSVLVFSFDEAKYWLLKCSSSPF
jgi:hypothetical protein